jgi:uncharacterized protein
MGVLKILKWVIIKSAIALIWTYRLIIPHRVMPRCRFIPGCSQYALEAIRVFGVKGIWMSAKRIAKCHPWGKYGYDPVPPINNQ